MVHPWIARLITVVTITATLWPAGTPTLARTIEEHFPIVIDAEGIPDLPDSAVAGPTLVSLDNETAYSFGASLYFVPAALAVQIENATPIATEPTGALPAWLDGATAVGGPGLGDPYGRTEALVELLPGTYAVAFNAFDPASGTLIQYALEYDDGTPFLISVSEATTTDPEPTPTRSSLAPTATASTDPEDEATEEPIASEPTSDDPMEVPTEIAELPDDTATVVMTDDSFLLPTAFPIGAQTWEVVNQGQLPHAMIVVAVPLGTTPDQLRLALFPSPAESAQAAAAAAPFDTSAMTNVGGLGPLAPGLSAAAALDLAPGTYAVFSALPDPTTGEPDGAQGLLAVFLIG